MIEVHDWERVGKTESPHVGQALSPVDEQHHEYGQGQAPADGFLAQQRTKLWEWPHSGHVSGVVGIADGMAFGIDLVLCENAPQVSHPRFGLAVGTLDRKST